MKTPRFELKDFRLNTLLDMLSTHDRDLPNFSTELNRQWIPGQAMAIKFGNRFSVDLTSEDVKENHEFQPNSWNPLRSWNIPENVDLMFSIQEIESGTEIARLRGYFDGEYFRRPNREPMHSFCRGVYATKYKSLIKRWPTEETEEVVTGTFLELVAAWERRINEYLEDEDEE